MAQQKPCPHKESLANLTKERLYEKFQEVCQTCKVEGPNLWACLQSDCTYVGCGELHSDHSTTHSRNLQHVLTANLTTFRIWCYECEQEIFLDLEPAEPDEPVTQTPETPVQDNALPVTSHLIRAVPIAVGEEGSETEEDELRPRGLAGMKNIGNSCYMNAALQALSNCPPLTQFFLECGGLVRTDKKPGLCKSYQKLITEIWHKNRPSCVTPSSLAQGIKLINPMFRGCAQQDTQEFLRCLMDQLHEELKEPMTELTIILEGNDTEQRREGERSPPSEEDYQSCESGSNGDHNETNSVADSEPQLDDDSEPEALDSPLVEMMAVGPEANISEKERMKERRMPGSLLHGGSQEMDEDADVDTAVEDIASALWPNEENEGQAAENPNVQDLNVVNIRTYNDLRALEERSHLRVPDNDAFALQNLLPPGSLVRCEEDLYPWTYYSALRSVGPTYTIKKTRLTFGSKKKQPIYRSVISDIFDGSILSLVQCLTCDRLSSRVETFQDLSLPIPGKEDLAKLHATIQQNAQAKAPPAPESMDPQGWLSYIMDSIRRFVTACIPTWFWGPTVTLEDCLTAFFASDELKGENMYSCERCKKLRNGIKYCRVLQLPEVLCIHLKRFRHEVSYSFKISHHVSFPLEGLDMKPYLAKESQSQITTYDLLSVICHHGTAGSGHYITYCQNVLNGRWYEFDDQYVTEVHETVVQNAEAYVFFYRKNSEESLRQRQKVVALTNIKEPSLLRFYISREWLNKFNTFTEPGQISNHTFLCPHGGVSPYKYNYIDDVVVIIQQNVWDYLHARFGGGPAVNHLYMCVICQMEKEVLEQRRKLEMDTFIKLNKEFQAQESPSVILCISMQWFREWENFVKGKETVPPGPIENIRIGIFKGGNVLLKKGADYGQISEDTWRYLVRIYGGGPEITMRHHNPQQGIENRHDGQLCRYTST